MPEFVYRPRIRLLRRLYRVSRQKLGRWLEILHDHFLPGPLLPTEHAAARHYTIYTDENSLSTQINFTFWTGKSGETWHEPARWSSCRQPWKAMVLTWLVRRKLCSHPIPFPQQQLKLVIWLETRRKVFQDRCRRPVNFPPVISLHVQVAPSSNSSAAVVRNVRRKPSKFARTSYIWLQWWHGEAIFLPDRKTGTEHVCAYRTRQTKQTLFAVGTALPVRTLPCLINNGISSLARRNHCVYRESERVIWSLGREGNSRIERAHCQDHQTSLNPVRWNWRVTLNFIGFVKFCSTDVKMRARWQACA